MRRPSSASTLRLSRTSQAFSQMEMLIVVAILGLMASIGVGFYETTMGQVEATVASNLKETLNTAVHRFNEANYELIYSSTATGTDLYVLQTLQYVNSSNPSVGSPYVRADWNPVEDSNTSDYRIAWQGTLFTLLSPGTAGTGLKVNFSGTDLGVNVTFPSNFTLAGA